MDKCTCLLCNKDSRGEVSYNCQKYGIGYTLHLSGLDSSPGNMNFILDKPENRERIKSNSHNIAGYIRDQGSKEDFIINKDNINFLMNSLTNLKVSEKLDRILNFLYEIGEVGSVFYHPIKIYGKFFLEGVEPASKINLLPIAYSKNYEEVAFLIRELINQKKLTQLEKNNSTKVNFKISSKGYESIERNKLIISDTCFVAMWFDEEEFKSKKIFDEAIKPAVEELGYRAKRVDFHEHNNVILDEIEGLIRQSKFMVSDLSGHRCGVYFESGFAKALGKPIIYTCEDESFDKIHFDVKHINCLKWSREGDGLKKFKEGLKSRIENTLGKGSYFK